MSNIEKDDSLSFYRVNATYAQYLYDEDVRANGFSCVPKFDYTPPQKEKFVCGVILKVGSLDYLAPVSSYKVQKGDNVLLLNRKGQPTSSIRLNFMFPVPFGQYVLYDFSAEVDLKYRGVVQQEWRSANHQRERIRQQAIITYQKVKAYLAQGKVLRWACNFPFLETKADEWIRQHS